MQDSKSILLPITQAEVIDLANLLQQADKMGIAGLDHLKPFYSKLVERIPPFDGLDD